MGRRWLHSVDLETDAQDRPLAEQSLIALGQAIADGRVKVDAGGFAAASTPNGAVEVGTDSTEILAANANRKYALITNDGAETVYLSFGDDAVMHEGLPLGPGVAYEILPGNLYTGAINGICESGGMNVCVVEA